MRTLGVVVIVVSFLLSGCKKDSSKDLLLDSSLLGEWELMSISNDVSMHCCEFIEFSLDENLDDFIGNYISYGPEFNTTGIFEFFEVDGTILFTHDGNYELNDIIIDGNLLNLTKQDNNGESISREYRKL